MRQEFYMIRGIVALFRWENVLVNKEYQAILLFAKIILNILFWVGL